MMKRRKIKIIVMSAVVLLAAVIFWRTAAFTFFYYPDDAGLASSTPALSLAGSAVTHSAGQPVRLAIPALGVNAAVQYVGVNAKGNMRAPSNFTDVSWYEYGASPGVLGSAVMAGHVDNGLGLPGVFKNLGALRPGNDIYVTAKNGAKLHFVVSGVESYPMDQVPVDALFNQSDTSRLNLVTCDGAWIAGQKTYDHRLVVFSTLQSS